ncbi:hypothetical protein BAUCODRAFT_335498 [Baudoinia panamericana UAMH 10762]|uniref:Uncharacterized protein n=1 Tax=Baudoinia panamericana (strain UAMH 10762) TaxID=717646 RepID=M2M2V5_BAUPA|nr:uncharacterized protein BAUCODRAFT_335498 [Baudoinia panamericana UAMH 10762]EMC90861.1 hypothetical protein BAUCODRAFT_335498 [Baudoinia panamericana UAMH 10762]
MCTIGGSACGAMTPVGVWYIGEGGNMPGRCGASSFGPILTYGPRVGGMQAPCGFDSLAGQVFNQSSNTSSAAGGKAGHLDGWYGGGADGVDLWLLDSGMGWSVKRIIPLPQRNVDIADSQRLFEISD